MAKKTARIDTKTPQSLEQRLNAADVQYYRQINILIYDDIRDEAIKPEM